MDGTFSHEAFGWVEQMDATRRLGRIGMDELNEKMGQCEWMHGWMDTRMHEWAGWDGMDIQMNGWLNHQKAKPRMVGSVQWQAGKTHAIWAWAKKMTEKEEKDRKRQKKKQGIESPIF